MRTFIAVELTELRNPIAVRQKQLRSLLHRSDLDGCIRWSPVKNAHLTLRFLGDTTDEQIQAIGQTLPTICRHHGAFELTVGTLGAFPNMDRPRVLWLGLGGDVDPLHALQSDIEEMVRDVGMSPEKRPFSPHITLGRVKRAASRSRVRQVGEALRHSASRPIDAQEDDHTTVAQVILYHSQLQRGGSVYTPLTTAPLTTTRRT